MKLRRIAFVVHPGIQSLDLVGPYEVLQGANYARRLQQRAPEYRVQILFAATAAGLVRNEQGKFALQAERNFEALATADLVLVPGGDAERRAREDRALLDGLRAAHARGAWVVSVCTSALVLGAAGLLQGRRAATHWLATKELAKFGATPAAERYHFDGKLVTCAGVSAGIDMALALTAKLSDPRVAQAIQLGLEYDPQPPFQTGTPEKSPRELLDFLRARSRFAESA